MTGASLLTAATLIKDIVRVREVREREEERCVRERIDTRLLGRDHGD